MTLHRWSSRAAAAGVWAFALAAAGCGSSDKPAGNGETNGKDGDPAVPVSTVAVGRAAVARKLLLAGKVMPESEVRLAAKMSGRVEQLSVDTGQDVAAGQVVAVLDRQTLQAGLDQASAAAGVAAAEARVAVIAVSDAERDWKRAQELFAGGVIDEQARDKAKAALDTAAARGDLAAARKLQAAAAVDAARAALAETEIRATVGGTVTHRLVDRGDFVSPGQPMLVIQDLKTVKVTASISQADLRYVSPGATAGTVMVDGVEGAFEAKLSKVEPVLDQATLSAAIELSVPNRRRPKGGEGEAGGSRWELVAGMSARVELAVESRTDAVVVPLEAVRNDSLKDFVFVAEATAGDGPAGREATARRIDVKLGIGSDGLIEVVEPADLAGRQVVVRGVSRLTDGCRILLDGKRHGEADDAPPALLPDADAR